MSVLPIMEIVDTFVLIRLALIIAAAGLDIMWTIGIFVEVRMYVAVYRANSLPDFQLEYVRTLPTM